MSDPLGPVHITGRDIYDAVIRLTASVDRIANQATSHADDLKDHESRLRHLEARQWPLPAASLLIAAAALGVALLPVLK